MGHAQTHGHEPPGDPALAGEQRTGDRRSLGLALALTAAFTVVEAIGGVLTGSLALLADAAHMLSDNVALALALGAVWLAGRPATNERTFGFKRAEILAAFVNGLALVAVSAWIMIEAIGRLDDPPEVAGGTILAIASAGLLVNLAAASILSRGGGESLNVSAALRHVLADLLGSVGVIVAALIIITTDWNYADPVVGLLIAVLVAISSWGILRDSSRILLEAPPRGIDVGELGRGMAGVPGVNEVHDLHVWTITTGFPALAAHVLVDPEADCHAKRRELETLLRERFELEHTTLQVDHSQPELLQLENPARKGSA